MRSRNYSSGCCNTVHVQQPVQLHTHSNTALRASAFCPQTVDNTTIVFHFATLVHALRVRNDAAAFHRQALLEPSGDGMLY